MDEIDKMLQEHATVPTQPSHPFAFVFTLFFYGIGMGMLLSTFKVDLSSVERFAENWSGLAYLSTPFQDLRAFILIIGLMIAIFSLRIYLIHKNKAHLFSKYNLIGSILFFAVGLVVFLLN